MLLQALVAFGALFCFFGLLLYFPELGILFHGWSSEESLK